MGFCANYLLNLAALALGRQPARPLLFSYYVTHRCPLDCRYCSDGEGNPFKATAVPELDTAGAKRLITILARASDTLDLTGGEPMMRPDLEELLDHARRCGLRTVLNTKGIGLPRRPGLMRADVLVLSVDSLRPAKLAELHGCAEDVARQALEALEFALSRRAAAKTQVVLSAVATPGNLEDAAEVLAFASRHGLGFHLSPQIVGVRAHPALRRDPRYARLIGEALERKRAGCGVLGVPDYLEGIRDFRPFRCHPLLMPVIRPDGKMVYPCLERPAVAIDLLEAGSHREALRKARAAHGPLPHCRDCCHIFCHMALSLLQRRPLQALREGRHWAAIRAAGPERLDLKSPGGSRP